jgi:KDO2-lipid IV(A) lauroyltransferase
MLYWVHLLCTQLVRIIPPRAAYALVGWFAPVVSPLWGEQYRHAVANMERVLGPAPSRPEVRRQVRNVFRNYARYMVDLLRLPVTGPDEVRRRVDAYGLQHIESGLTRGRGVVLVTGHVGNWDIAGAYLAARGYPINVIVETLQPPRWNELVQRIRVLTGMRAIPLEQGVREMLDALRRNEILGVLIDRPLEKKGVPVHFFNAETRVPGGAATLAVRSGAAILVAAVLRNGDRFEAHVSPPIEFERSGDQARDVAAITQRAMSWLESLISRHPDQWYMFRNMWPEAAST